MKKLSAPLLLLPVALLAACGTQVADGSGTVATETTMLSAEVLDASADIAADIVDDTPADTARGWLFRNIVEASAQVNELATLLQLAGAVTTETDMVAACSDILTVVGEYRETGMLAEPDAAADYVSALDHLHRGALICVSGAFDEALPDIQEGGRLLESFDNLVMGKS